MWSFQILSSPSCGVPVVSLCRASTYRQWKAFIAVWQRAQMLPVHLIWRKMCRGEDMKHRRFSASARARWELMMTGAVRGKHFQVFVPDQDCFSHGASKRSEDESSRQSGGCSQRYSTKCISCWCTDCSSSGNYVTVMLFLSHPKRSQRGLTLLSLVNNFDGPARWNSPLVPQKDRTNQLSYHMFSTKLRATLGQLCSGSRPRSNPGKTEK